jgi:hypothetical protein
VILNICGYKGRRWLLLQPILQAGQSDGKVEESSLIPSLSSLASADSRLLGSLSTLLSMSCGDDFPYVSAISSCLSGDDGSACPWLVLVNFRLPFIPTENLSTSIVGLDANVINEPGPQPRIVSAKYLSLKWHAVDIARPGRIGVLPLGCGKSKFFRVWISATRWPDQRRLRSASIHQHCHARKGTSPRRIVTGEQASVLVLKSAIASKN